MFLLQTFLPIWFGCKVTCQRISTAQNRYISVKVPAECNEVCERYDAAGRLLNDCAGVRLWPTLRPECRGIKLTESLLITSLRTVACVSLTRDFSTKQDLKQLNSFSCKISWPGESTVDGYSRRRDTTWCSCSVE